MTRRSLEIDASDLPPADALWNLPDDAQLRLEIDDSDPEAPPLITLWWLVDANADDIEPSEEERAWFDDQFSRVTWEPWLSRPYLEAVRRAEEARMESRYGL